MSDSELSSVLSSPPASDGEEESVGPMDKFMRPAHQTSSPPLQRKRPASPPHEETLADNPDIAFIVAFQASYHDAFPPKWRYLGPQTIERGIVNSTLSSEVEALLRVLLGLALDRKNPPGEGHYGSALEEVMSLRASEWPGHWNRESPLAKPRSFDDMSAQSRLSVMRYIIFWCLSSSNVIKSLVNNSYNNRKKDRSVHALGVDGQKRMYWLIQGKDETLFRLYREKNRYSKDPQFWSMAGSCAEIRTVIDMLRADGSKASRSLGNALEGHLPRLEEVEAKCKKSELRRQRKNRNEQAVTQTSIYEGRTRGKRMKYTFSDGEDEVSDVYSTRRSIRRATPANDRPVVTFSGRQVRSRTGGVYGEPLLHGRSSDVHIAGPQQYDGLDASEDATAHITRAGRSRTSAPQRNGRMHIDGYNRIDEMGDEEEADEWDGGEDDEDDDLGLHDDDDDDDDDDGEQSVSEDESDSGLHEAAKESLLVTLQIRADRLAAVGSAPAAAGQGHANGHIRSNDNTDTDVGAGPVKAPKDTPTHSASSPVHCAVYSTDSKTIPSLGSVRNVANRAPIEGSQTANGPQKLHTLQHQ